MSLRAIGPHPSTASASLGRLLRRRGRRRSRRLRSFAEDLQVGTVAEQPVAQRLVEDAVVAEEKRDEQPAHAAVAVEERVDRLELDVGQPGTNERCSGELDSLERC
jgi:hypothetical protein